MNRQREDNKSLNAVSIDDLESMIRNENVLLLDVRPSIEFEFGHITGAVSVPMNELMEQLKNIKRIKNIIAYCRGHSVCLPMKLLKY